ncbi:hypothetical protein [Salmonella enterica]|uniref:Uncharacterized protein n=2 Tax=Salmonella enterica TaxID=28901 RepID=A0A379QHB5_SALER|nr:hypothetical protein [Salmonella enterica]ECC1658029.1 hypothetical protein [Salmonella enterica subsp. salamae]ASG86794.1 hypothetical protein LFZ47_03915 [Salmonella enterica subsp. salamae serovar 55:k:z39 str. 1315K]ECD9415905.1 hypothetical protein [Salmonella enterica subsp. salamae]ECF5932763.1 hypothetical protein [Salmonella enterica subsp. salamae]ECG1251675.1 hypothetical protein [Salmonella enterica subsp. salamae]
MSQKSVSTATMLFNVGGEATCVGCGCSDNDACVNEFRDTCDWLKVNRQTGMGVCSFCPEFLNHPLTDDVGCGDE